MPLKTAKQYIMDFKTDYATKDNKKQYQNKHQANL